ncbi:MAG: hypothetical protein ACI867_002571 [Glaciecola sp.]
MVDESTPDTQEPTEPLGHFLRRGLRGRLLGDRETLGLWTLPAFLIVGLAGAVLAGTFTVVWQTQKIQALEDDMQNALTELRDGVSAVEEAGDQALAEIAAQVGDVRAVLNAGLPVESASEIGVGLLRVDVPVAQESTQSEPQPAPVARIGAATAVAIDGPTTFFATSYALVADPFDEGGVLDAITIDVGRGRVSARVHSWDETRDLALVRADVGAVTLGNWRPVDEPLKAGDRVFMVGLTTAFDTVQQPGDVTFADATTLLTDHDVVGTLRGAALIDSEGRLLGVASADYRPFVDDERASGIPIRLLCERLLRSCADRSGAAGEPAQG